MLFGFFKFDFALNMCLIVVVTLGPNSMGFFLLLLVEGKGAECHTTSSVLVAYNPVNRCRS